MKNLLYKELKLVVQPGTYFMALCALLLIVPSYPYIVGVAYGLVSFMVTFNVAVSNKDHEFTSMLPVSRSQIVLAKVINVLFTEMLTIAVAIPAALLSSLVFNKGGNIVGMDANFAFFGITLTAYAIFNAIFLPWYFRTGYKTGWPLAVGIGGFLLFATACEITIAIVPELKANIDSLDPSTIPYQLIVLGFGIAVYVTSLFFAWKKSVKNFAKVSL